MTPGADFRTARKALGYSQKELAEALQMGKWGWQTISRWESDDFEGEIPGPVQVAINCLLHHPPTDEFITLPRMEME